LIDESRFRTGDIFAEFLGRPLSNKPLWEAIYNRATVDDELISRVQALGGRWHLLVLNEDWCGDSVNILPYLAKLTDGLENMEMRIVRRDENLDIMDAHLTGKSRSIPVVILLDEDFRECGWWGPRPTELQSWVIEEGLKLPKDERYKQVRTWYARDRGQTTMAEIVGMLEQCRAPRKEEG
jgi:Thioredoxin